MSAVAKGLIYIGIAVNGVVFLAGLVFFVMTLTGGGINGMLVAGAMMLVSGVIIWVLASWLRTAPSPRGGDLGGVAQCRPLQALVAR